MEKSEEYFNKEYGVGHIKTVIDLDDRESLYGLIQEFAEQYEQWISVKDRLPDKYCQCLIYCPQSFPKNCRVLSANYYDDNKLFYCDAFEIVHEDVTHWMPLIKEPNK